MRDLLTGSGRLFVQIGDETMHRVRAVMEETSGDQDFVSMIAFKTTHYLESDNASDIENAFDFLCKNTKSTKHGKPYRSEDLINAGYSKNTTARAYSRERASPRL